MRCNTKQILSVIFTVSTLIPLSLNAATFGLSDIPNTFTFSRNIRANETVTPDVSYLQFVLNQSIDTQVAETGAGSLSGLTNFYGPKTLSALNRFQEKYRDEILTPANIPAPTGYVGPLTRSKLNQVLASLFNGTYIEARSTTPLVSSLSGSNSGTSQVFQNTFTGTNTSSNNFGISQRPPVITSFSTYRALSGQLMSLFGGQFRPLGNTIYLGGDNVGTYASQDNGSKITFKVPDALETGSYEVGVVNEFGTTSTGFLYLNVVKQAVTTNSVAQTFTPSLTTVYPNNSTNLNDLVFLYGENFAFNNTLETNLGNTTVRSTNRKTLSFLIGELPYYRQAFDRYKGQSINVTMRIRNENGLSKEELVHVIRFPNTTEPTINTSVQGVPESFGIGNLSDDFATTIQRQQLEANNATSSNANRNGNSSSTSSVTGSSGNAGGNTSNSNSSSDSSSIINNAKPAADPLLQQLREISPVHKFLSDPVVKNDSSSSGGSSGNSGSTGGAAAGAGFLGGSSSSSGGSGSGSGGGGGSTTNFGGTITQATICTCSAGLPTLLSIQDVRGSTIQAMYTPGSSSLKQNYNIWTPGVKTLGGMTSGGGDCQVGVSPYCSSAGSAQYSIDFIRGIGTSVR